MHLSQQNIVFLFNGAAGRRSRSRSTGLPGPSGLPWIPPLVVLFAARRARRRCRRSGGALLAVLVALVVVSDVAHAIAFEIPRPGANPTKVVQFLGGSFVSIAVWVAAVPTVVALLRRRVGGALRRGLRRAAGGADRRRDRSLGAVEVAAARRRSRLAHARRGGRRARPRRRARRRCARPHASQPDGRRPDDGRGPWLSLLVSGLSDAELARIALELDADEVLEVAFRELAVRAAARGRRVRRSVRWRSS